MIPDHAASLAEEFPQWREQIHALKQSDAHFARQFEEYNTIAHAVHRIESGAEASSDEWLETLKKQRLQLKDALLAQLKRAA